MNDREREAKRIHDRAWRAQRYIKNREVLLNRQKEYNERNREVILVRKKQHYVENREKIAKRRKQYRAENCVVVREQKKKWYRENREASLERGKQYVARNREIISKRRKQRYRDNRLDKLERDKKSYIKNREKRIKASIQYERQRVVSDPEFKLKKRLRGRIRDAIQRGYKSASTMKLLGCHIDFAIAWIEIQFKPGMNWENNDCNGWHIDHIIPCASFDLTDPIQQKKCFHFTNLQPLWWWENLTKGAKIAA